MTERPRIMMPVSEESAAMQMLIEEQRRMRTTMDKVNDTLVSVGIQLASMDADRKHDVERRTMHEQRLNGHDERFGRVEGRVDLLEDENHRRAGAMGVTKWLAENINPISMTILGVVFAVVAVLKITGRI